VRDKNAGNVFAIILLLFWILSLEFVITWSVSEIRKQTAETNKIVKEILAEKKQ
jgi:hypothetical protein